MAGRGEAQSLNNSGKLSLAVLNIHSPAAVKSLPSGLHYAIDIHFPCAGQGGESNVPSNVTNAAVVGDNKGGDDKKEETADTKVNVDDAVVAKAPTGEEVDFKKISIDEALKVLKVKTNAGSQQQVFSHFKFLFGIS